MLNLNAKKLRRLAIVLAMVAAAMMMILTAAVFADSGDAAAAGDAAVAAAATTTGLKAIGKIRTSFMLGLVFIETVVIYALLTVILIIFVL